MKDGWQIRAKELAAGSGRWCKGFVKAGFGGTAEDILTESWQDLTDATYINGLKVQASGKEFVVSHVGTECTTFSTAANPPYRDRSDEGVAGLADVLRHPDKGPIVRSANTQADNTAILLLHYAKCHILSSCENPANSILWEYWEKRGWLTLLHNAGYRFHKTHYCWYGTRYQKATKILSNYPIPQKPCRHASHPEVLKGKVRTKFGWKSRTKMANPYPHGLVRDWVRSVLAALAARYA